MTEMSPDERITYGAIMGLTDFEPLIALLRSDRTLSSGVRNMIAAALDDRHEGDVALVRKHLSGNGRTAAQRHTAQAKRWQAVIVYMEENGGKLPRNFNQLAIYKAMDITGLSEPTVRRAIREARLTRKVSNTHY